MGRSGSLSVIARDHGWDRELLEERWRAVGLDGQILTCSICRTAGPGVQVRLGYASGTFQRIRHVANLEDARGLAENWRRLVLAQGFAELSL